LNLKEKTKAANVLSDYCLTLWHSCNSKYNSKECRLNIPLAKEKGNITLSDILMPFIGPEPELDNPLRSYWVAVKYEITVIAYELWLKKEQLWVQSIPCYGINIRNKPELRESSRLLKNIRRLVNHALELNISAELSEYLPIRVRDQYRANRDFQLQLFFRVQELMSGTDLKLDEETRQLYTKLGTKVSQYIQLSEPEAA